MCIPMPFTIVQISTYCKFSTISYVKVLCQLTIQIFMCSSNDLIATKFVRKFIIDNLFCLFDIRFIDDHYFRKKTVYMLSF